MLDGLTDKENEEVQTVVNGLSENLGVAPKTILINYTIANILCRRGFTEDKAVFVVNNETYTFVKSEYGYNFSLKD